MKSKEIAQIFREIAQMLELKGANVFRIRAYERAALNIENLGDQLSSLADTDALTSIPGIGKDLSQKIKEYLQTGRIDYYQELKSDLAPGLLEMLAIPGLGPKTVRQIYEKLGIKTVQELKQKAASGQLRQIEGIKEKTESNIIKGIELLKKSDERMLISQALDIAESFISRIKKFKEVKRLELAGSLRRRKETIKDIDILAGSKEPEKVMEKFVKLDLVDRVTAKGRTKSSVIAKASNIAVDLRVVDEKSFGAALLYFTGSKAFNIRLRGLASKADMKINEYGLFLKGKKGKLLASKSEEDIFAYFKMPFIAPELREDRGEIEAALSRNLPRLLTIKDIKGDLHVHSKYSDGDNTIQELCLAGIKFGYEYLGIADHSQSLKIAGGLSIEQLKKKIKEVRKVDGAFSKIKLLCGSEVDILSDGSLDYPDDILKDLDYVIAAIHSGFKQSKSQLTKRIVTACKNRYVNIVAHPTGGLWGVREPYEIEMDEVFRAAADNSVALEINSHPERLDLNDINASLARKHKVKLVINTDSHNTDHLSLIQFGINIARRSWLDKSEVVNTMGVEKFLKWLKK
ncbi:MAG: DNA polymerase/3'-5' exonuclease PolX [Candidatus Omnitrophica bacterium]|nr:DNA polymerase/3'-5' exonuclease PolX [Candidatus Omnitrophota bacterium]